MAQPVNVEVVSRLTWYPPPQGLPDPIAPPAMTGIPAYVGVDVITPGNGNISTLYIYLWTLNLGALPSGVSGRRIFISDPLLNPGVAATPQQDIGSATSVLFLGLTPAEIITVSVYNYVNYFDPVLGGITQVYSTATTVTIDPSTAPGFVAPAAPAAPTISVGAQQPFQSTYYTTSFKALDGGLPKFLVDNTFTPWRYYGFGCTAPGANATNQAVASWLVTITGPPATSAQYPSTQTFVELTDRVGGSILADQSFYVQLPFTLLVTGIETGETLTIKATNGLNYLTPVGLQAVPGPTATATITGQAPAANVPSAPAAPTVSVTGPVPEPNPNVSLFP